MSGRWTAVATAAGHATRFRPFSAVVPKEMLPLGADPALLHVITECLTAGASDVVIITRPDDTVVPAFVDVLVEDGMPVRCVPEDLDHGYGNGAGVLTLRDELVNAPAFAVAFGDDVILGGADLAAMHALGERPDVDAVIAAQVVPREDISSFGVVDVDLAEPDRVLEIRQRPDPATVTEPLAVVSRLVLRPSIFDLIRPAADAHGEVDLGVAVGKLAHAGRVLVHRITGQWVTVGEPHRYHQALQTYWNTQAATRP